MPISYEDPTMKWMDDETDSNLDDDDDSISSEEVSNIGKLHDCGNVLKSVQEIFDDSTIWDSLMVRCPMVFNLCAITDFEFRIWKTLAKYAI